MIRALSISLICIVGTRLILDGRIYLYDFGRCQLDVLSIECSVGLASDVGPSVAVRLARNWYYGLGLIIPSFVCPGRSTLNGGAIIGVSGIFRSNAVSPR
jgi:hypothetical protein